MKILFISRAYPPVIGGIENQNLALAKWLSIATDCRCIVNRRGKLFLPIFVPLAVVSALFMARKVDVILLGDGVAAAIGWAVKKVYPGKPLVSVLHGLDITYRNTVYQNLWVKRFFRSIDHFIAVSRSTANLAISHGILLNDITVIPNGIEDIAMSFSQRASKDELSSLLSKNLSERKILLTVGRLVERKGVAWFIRNVLPALSDEYIYVIAGDGPERSVIEKLLSNKAISSKVVYLGMIDDETKHMLFSQCDLFVQPNIPVPGDAEGFGITVLEAGMYGMPVIASDLEGLKDSVHHGDNGWHIESQDSIAFAAKIKSIFNTSGFLQKSGRRARKYVLENYAWDIVIRRYEKALKTVIERC